MLKINKESTQLPNCTYVNGWFNGKLFEFTYYYSSNEFKFGTSPFIDGAYVECEPLPESEKKALSEAWLSQRYGTVILTVPYVSVWDGGVEVETTADVDIRTGEVTKITQSNISGLEVCEREYVVMNGEQVEVYNDERGYEYWADIDDVYDTAPKSAEITTQCINGTLRVGDMVLSIPTAEYACLIGRVMEINPVNTPEHDTDNKTDDVHVNFAEDYSAKRIREIEEMFTDLYDEPKDFDDCPIDDTIMAPEWLIRITGISHDLKNTLLDSGYNASCYCYQALEQQTVSAAQTEIMEEAAGANPNTVDLDVAKMVERIFSFIDSAVALAGFKVLDGDRNSVIIRHCESDTDFEIKVEEIPG